MRWLVMLSLLGCTYDFPGPTFATEDAELPDARWRDADPPGPGNHTGSDPERDPGGGDPRGACQPALRAEPAAVHLAWEDTEAEVEIRSACDVIIDAVLEDGAFSAEVALGPLSAGVARRLIIRPHHPGEVRAGRVVVQTSAGRLEIPVQVAPPACLSPLRPMRAPVGGTDTQWVSVGACGAAGSEVRRLRIDHPAFTIDDRQLPSPLRLGQPAALGIHFAPPAAGEVEAQLEIEVVGRESPVISVPLLGVAGDFCPVVDAGPDRVVPTVEAVTLTGTDLNPHSALAVDWAWEVLSRPDGSVSQPLESFFNNASPADGGPEDDVTTPHAQFFVDLEGSYVLELRATSGQGCAHTDTLTVVASADASPPEALAVELEWAGEAELDLHLHHPEGEFGRASDCWDDHPRPGWLGHPVWSGAPGRERIVVQSPPEAPAPYGLGVSFRSGPPTTATVRLWRSGQVETFTRELAEPGELWEVGRLRWPEGGLAPYAP